MAAIQENSLSLIGKTPLIGLNRIHPGPGRVLAKAEFLQPGGSVKDRAALRIIQDARASAQLSPGQPEVEMTSGNMGSGLAVVCNVLGHPLIVTISEGNSPARAEMLRALSAEVILVPQVDGSPGRVTGADVRAAIERAIELAQERDAFYVDQFNNRSGLRAHEEGTGPEIWEDTDGDIDAFVSMVGSGGTFVGASRFLKRKDPKVQCIAVEPAGAEALTGNEITKECHLLQGAGYAFVPPMWEPGLADGFAAITDQQASDFRAALAVEEGSHVGYTSGANVCAAIQLMKSGALGSDPTVVTILADTGLKY